MGTFFPAVSSEKSSFVTSPGNALIATCPPHLRVARSPTPPSMVRPPHLVPESIAFREIYYVKQEAKKEFGVEAFAERPKIEFVRGEIGVRGVGSGICPVLVVWPSQGSLGGEGDGRTSHFPAEEKPKYAHPGIDSNQESPLQISQTPEYVDIPPSTNSLKASRTLLHPDHARTTSHRSPQNADSKSSLEDPSGNGGLINSCSSSAASSTTSIAAGTVSWMSDPLQDRRSSTPCYSLLDALDLEYALMRAAGRGSIGPCSLSQSLQKLSFTQSLAFPALARGLDDKRNKSEKSPKIDPLDSGVNAFAKVATALLLVLVSVLVFGIVYKFVRT